MIFINERFTFIKGNVVTYRSPFYYLLNDCINFNNFNCLGGFREVGYLYYLFPRPPNIPANPAHVTCART